MIVTVAGTEIAAPVDSSGHFSLDGVPPGDIQLRFTNAGVDAAIPIQGVAEQEQIHIAVTVSGGSATMTSQQRTDSQHRVGSHGLVSGLSGTCPDLTFTVNGTTIVANASTIFEDGSCSTVQNGTRVEIKGTRRSNGSVLATRVDIDTPSPDPQVELKGSVSALGGTCPAITFTVNGTSVVANSSTRFEDGPCSAVQNGTRVEVKGTRQSNGSVLANKVDIDTPTPHPQVEVKGSVSALAGTCPSLTFTVNGTSVATNGSTRFEDGTCGTVQNGTSVEVKGTRQTDGTVLATKVDIDPPAPPPQIEVKGLVSALAGTCPNLTFTASGTSIVTNSSTRFEDGPCTVAQNGTSVEVRGTRQSDGSVLATKVDIDEPDPDVELKGVVSGLGGACPNLSFSVNGTPVVTNNLTRFEDGPCSVVQNGTRVEVRGTRQSDGSVLATKVDIDEPDLDIDLKGTVSGLGSACPSLTFTVRGTSVVTNSATRFTDGPCSAIQNGTRLEVEGTRQANGSVLAHKVDIDR